jgi:Cu(I)/Ag(I) efflux system membrane protein CusA/SilA
MLIESALGGMVLTSTVEGRERFSVNLRMAQDYRSSLDEVGRLPIQTEQYGVIPLSAVTDIAIVDGPPMINSENAMLRGTVLFNVRGRDMGSVVAEAKEKISARFSSLPKGYYLQWSGQYENQVRAQQRLSIIIPIVLLIIGLILFITFRSWKEVVIVFVSIPVGLVGGVYSLAFFDVNFSVAVAAGFIALFGVAVETGVLMMAYMSDSLRQLNAENKVDISKSDIRRAIYDGAVPRVRPLLMTVLANTLGLLPILISSGTGSDVMKPIAIPFAFGLITSTVFVLIVLPVIYQILKEHELQQRGRIIVIEVRE